MNVGDRQSAAQLAVAYEKAARAWGDALISGSPDVANTWFDQCVATYRELRRGGRDAVAVLAPLLKSEDVGVTLAVASVLLEFFPDQAAATLREVSATKGLMGFTAKMTLREWEAGRLRFP